MGETKYIEVLSIDFINTIDGKIDKIDIVVISPVLDAGILWCFGYFTAPGAAGAFAKAVGKGQAGPGAVGDALPIKKQRIADPQKAGFAGIEDIAAI